MVIGAVNNMRYQSIGITFIFIFNLGTKLVACHLKDLGEVTINFTAVQLVLENRIVGGRPALLEQFPFNTQFFNKGGLCSAIIVTKQSALTAAHCFDLNKNTGEMRLYSASRFIFDRSSQEHEIRDFVIHPRYNETVIFSNDIAAILIADGFVFGKYVQVATLSGSRKWMREEEKMFIATGWGETSNGNNKPSKRLLQTTLRYISQKKCIKANNGLQMSPEMFCLYGDGKRDTCRGDSGGGIVWKNVVIGIVSHGNGCAMAPGMYVSVHYYKRWIKATIKKLISKFSQSNTIG